MNQLKKHLQRLSRSEEGLTLVELLLVLVISSTIIGLAYTALTSTLFTFDRIQAETSIRNEANLILARLNETLKDLDGVEIQNADPKEQFYTFDAIFIQNTVTGSTESRKSFVLDPTIGQMSIDGSMIHNPSYSLKGSYFSLSGNQLEFYLSIKKGTGKPMYSYAVYPIHH